MKQKTFLFLTVAILGLFLINSFFGGVSVSVKAATDDPVNGYAWSENIGWIQFNHNKADPVEFIKSSKKFKGYAWSEHVGWVTFNEGELGGCPSGECSARRSGSDVLGWAKALSSEQAGSGGWDGWISLNCQGTPDNCATSNYGVTYSASSGEFSGWAWGADVIGWLSFNCSNLGICGTSNYQASTNPAPVPTVTLVATPGSVDYEESSTLSWTSTDAIDCTASGDWSGLKATSGSESTGPLTESKTYSIECSGSGGTSDLDTVTVTVVSDFTLVSSNEISVLIVGELDTTSDSTTISVVNTPQFKEDITLSVQSITPNIPGVTYNFIDLPEPHMDLKWASSVYPTSEFSVNVPGSTPTGEYTIVIQGVGGGITRTTQVKLNSKLVNPIWEEI